jgi:hypothetical protein
MAYSYDRRVSAALKVNRAVVAALRKLLAGQQRVSDETLQDMVGPVLERVKEADVRKALHSTRAQLAGGLGYTKLEREQLRNHPDYSMESYWNHTLDAMAYLGWAKDPENDDYWVTKA